MDSVLVTGCSTGLGLETALYLAGRGLRVFATLRDLDLAPAVHQAAGERNVEVEILQLDVTDHRSIERAVEAVVARAGGVYGLVNNAGIGLRGCFEDLTDAEIRHVFEANVFGTMAVTRQVLPHMRCAGRGRIVTITSVGGRIATYALSAYCSTKFALEGFGESLALELAPLGLQSILIEPGIIMTTRWTTNRGVAEHASDPESPYAATFLRHEEFASGFARRSRTRPVHVAQAVHHALTARRPRMHYVVGRPASFAVMLRRYLPERLFEQVYFGTLLRQLAGGGTQAQRPLATASPRA